METKESAMRGTLKHGPLVVLKSVIVLISRRQLFSNSKFFTTILSTELRAYQSGAKLRRSAAGRSGWDHCVEAPGECESHVPSRGRGDVRRDRAQGQAHYSPKHPAPQAPASEPEG